MTWPTNKVLWKIIFFRLCRCIHNSHKNEEARNVHMKWNSSLSFMHRFARLFLSVCYCFDSLVEIGNKLLAILHFEDEFIARRAATLPNHFHAIS